MGKYLKEKMQEKNIFLEEKVFKNVLYAPQFAWYLVGNMMFFVVRKCIALFRELICIFKPQYLLLLPLTNLTLVKLFIYLSTGC